MGTKDTTPEEAGKSTASERIADTRTSSSLPHIGGGGTRWWIVIGRTRILHNTSTSTRSPVFVPGTVRRRGTRVAEIHGPCTVFAVRDRRARSEDFLAEGQYLLRVHEERNTTVVRENPQCCAFATISVVSLGRGAHHKQSVASDTYHPKFAKSLRQKNQDKTSIKHVHTRGPDASDGVSRPTSWWCCWSAAVLWMGSQMGLDERV